MDIDIPFNFDPVSTTIKTGAYTVPSGSYARVTPMSAMTVDAVDVFPNIFCIEYEGSTSHTIITAGVGEVIEATLYHDFDTNSTISITKTGTLTSGIQIASGSGPSFKDIRIGDGQSLIFNDQDAGTSRYILTGTNTNSRGDKKFWVTGGTDLDGDHYLVELYNSIS